MFIVSYKEICCQEYRYDIDYTQVSLKLKRPRLATVKFRITSCCFIEIIAEQHVQLRCNDECTEKYFMVIYKERCVNEKIRKREMNSNRSINSKCALVSAGSSDR